VTPTVAPSEVGDLAAIARIYGHAVRHGTASFEEEAPDVAELARRRDVVRDAGLPHLVARQGGIVVGFAHAGAFRPRPAYRHTVEGSVYVAPDAQRRGVGRRLLEALIDAAAIAGKRQMIAVIGDPGANRGSVALHTSLGFRRCGELEGVGFKFDRWLDILLMQRRLDG